MKKNWFKAIIGGISLTSAMFIFQACYGTPQDFGQDFHIEGKVTSKSTGKAIPGIQVRVESSGQIERTAKDGTFSMYIDKNKDVLVKFVDIDGKENGEYLPLEKNIETIDENLVLNVQLYEKE